MYNIGIDLGGTNIAAAIVDESGAIILKDSVPTLRERHYKAIIKDMTDLSINLMDEAGLGRSDIHSIGIGCPGLVDTKRGNVVFASNLKFNDAPVREEFVKILNRPVYIENDANAAAYGEFLTGAGRKYTDFIAVTLGTGVGSGVIINNKIFSGSNYGGAELGHMVIQAGGTSCNCGRRGCWDAYSSAASLVREARTAALLHPASLLNVLVEGDLDSMSAKTPFDAAKAGDAAAKRVIDWYLDYMAIGLVNVISIFQPQAIALGGGLSEEKDFLVNPLKEKMRYEINSDQNILKTELLVCELGNDAGLIGAAMLYRL